MRAFLLLCLSFSLLAGTAKKPDLSGNWKLNLSKSDFGNAPAPASLTTHIAHHDPEIKVHSEVSGSQGTYTTDYKWIADGRENVNVIRGKEIRASVVWNGRSLTSNARTSSNGADLTIIDLWNLSEDGQTLTVSRKVLGPQGAAEQTYVYEK